MLSAMRQNAGSWIIKILLGIIVVAFIFMGAGSFSARRAAMVAKVNGELISINEYQAAYDRMIQDLHRRLGDQFNDEMIKTLDIEKQALDRLIETAILRQTAEKEGIRVSKKELAASIVGMDAFQDGNGAFDHQRYKMVLSQNRLNPASFEAMQRDALLHGKLNSLLAGGVKVSDEEAREWYLWENASVTIDYAEFTPDAFKDLQASDEELKKYFDEHKEGYKTEPQIKARYLAFDPSAYLTKIEVSEDEIRQYYTDSEDEFRTPETVTTRQILLHLPLEADPDTVEKRRTEAFAVIQEARSGKDFVELARQYSEDPSGEKGRLMGPFTRDEMVKPLAEAAFELEVGEISDPVRTLEGWHILKIEGYEPSAVKPIEQVRDQIVQRVSEQKAKDMAYEEATALYDISYTGEDLVKNAADRKLELITTDWFARSNGPAGVPDSSAFAAIAFDLPLMDISDVAQIGGAYYLIQTIEEQPSHLPELEAVKEQVMAGATKEKREKAAEDAAKRFLEKARAGGDMTILGQQEGVEVRSVLLENRSRRSPEFEDDGAVSAEAFTLSLQDRFPKEVIKGKGGRYYVIALKEKRLPPAEGYMMAKNSIVSRLKRQKQMDLYQAWLAGLRKNSDITISKRFMDEGGA